MWKPPDIPPVWDEEKMSMREKVAYSVVTPWGGSDGAELVSDIHGGT
jgi:hypothetical protein